MFEDKIIGPIFRVKKIQKIICVITQKSAVLSRFTCYVRDAHKWREIITDDFHMDPVLLRGT